LRPPAVPLSTADMTAFLSKIQGNFDGIFAILFFGGPAVTFVNQAYDLGLTKKYKLAGRWRRGRVHPPAGPWAPRSEGFRWASNRYIPVLDAPLNTPYHKEVLR